MKIDDVVVLRKSECANQRRTIKKMKSNAAGVWITFCEDDNLLGEDIWHLAKYYEAV